MSNTGRSQTGFVEANSTRLYYEVRGEGHPLVLLHGGYIDQRMWDDQFEVFAQHYQVVRYDIRGFGKSEMPQVPYSSEEDLAAVLRKLNIEHTYLLGLSWGGLIALDFTLEYSDKVDALVLVGAAIGGFVPLLPEEELEREELRAAPFIKAAEERNIPQLLEVVMHHPTLVPSPQYPEARRRVREMLSEYSFVFVTDPAPRRQITPPAAERLTEIRVPTLILLGEEDALFVRQMADKLVQAIPQAKKVEIENTSHMPNLEKPESFNQIVLDFLAAL